VIFLGIGLTDGWVGMVYFFPIRYSYPERKGRKGDFFELYDLWLDMLSVTCDPNACVNIILFILR